jgi:uncharacterized iron-regulated membrane protein
MASWVRKVHLIMTAIVGAQLVVWTSTGLAFTLFDFTVVHGDADRARDTAVTLPPEPVPIGHAIARARTARPTAGAVQSVELTMLDGRPIYVASFASGPEALVDAASGDVVAIDAKAAVRVARRAFARPVASRAVESRDVDGRRAFVVTLDDERATEVTVDGVTGKVSAWQNRAWRTFDALWSLHVVGYIDRKSPANWPLRIVAFVAFAAALSGAGLLGVRAGRRWRRARPELRSVSGEPSGELAP